MPRPEQLVTVKIKESTRLLEWRTINIEIRGRCDLFHLPDILSDAGAVHDLQRLLKAANRKAIGDYIRSAKQYVRGDRKKKVEKGKCSEVGGRQDKRSGAKFSQAGESLDEK